MDFAHCLPDLLTTAELKQGLAARTLRRHTSGNVGLGHFFDMEVELQVQSVFGSSLPENLPKTLHARLLLSRLGNFGARPGKPVPILRLSSQFRAPWVGEPIELRLPAVL